MEETFAEWLIGLRGGRTQKAVAEGAGIQRASLVRAEKGQAFLARGTLERLMGYYGASIEEGVRRMAQDRTNREIEALNGETLAYNVDEAAQALRVSRDTVDGLIRSGRLRTVKIGTRKIVPKFAIEEFLQQASTPGRVMEGRDALG